MSGHTTECLFVILPELYKKHSGYELGTIWPGLSGVYPTGIFVGDDLTCAIDIANDMNLANGYIPAFTKYILEHATDLRSIKFFNA